MLDTKKKKKKKKNHIRDMPNFRPVNHALLEQLGFLDLGNSSAKRLAKPFSNFLACKKKTIFFFFFIFSITKVFFRISHTLIYFISK